MGYLISSIRAFSLLAVLMSSLLIPTAFSDDHHLNTISTAFYGNHHLHTICTRNYTKNSTTDTYANNLQNLFDDLYSNTPTTGFRMNSSGQVCNRAFGLSLCRGDISTHDCESCVDKARKNITEGCPNSLEAIIWYDYCLLKYSDTDFFGQIDTRNKLYMWNLNNASKPEEFNVKARELLSDLSKQASDDNNYMFAGGDRLFDQEENVTIYGVAQCTRDLSKYDCRKCLDRGVKELPGFTTKTSPVGGRTLSGSCNVGYEIYPFLNKSV